MNSVRNKIIIWGIDNFNTLGLMRQLGSEGLDLFLLVLGRKTGVATGSRWCTGYDVRADIGDGYTLLKEKFQGEKLKPIIITPGDEIIEFLDQHKPDAEQFFLFAGTKESGVLTRYDNKIKMAELAREVGIVVPQSLTLTKNTPIDDVIYPCFLKPSHIMKGHKNEFKCKKIVSRAELEHTLKYVREDSEFLLQQFIPVEKEYVVSGCRMMDGKTVVAGCYTTLRYADDGNSSYGYVSDEIPKEIDVKGIERFMEAIDYHGIFGFEYGLWNGKAYFFEVNLRNDGTSQTFWLAGAKRMLAWVYSLTGTDYSELCTRVQKPGYFMDEMMDIANVWHGRIARKEWKKQRTEAAYLKYYNEEDMRPYKVMRKLRWRLMLQYAVVKKYRLYIVYLMDRLKQLR